MVDKRMKPELRIALVAGGNASGGSFTGAALTEALKELLYYGVYRERRYRSIAVDVLAGAGAGALTLGIALRYLSHRLPADEAAATERLQAQFADFDWVPAAIRRELVAVQVVQDRLAVAWRERLTLSRLMDTALGNGADATGRVPTKAIDEAVREIFGLDTGAGPAPRLLAERTVFACILAHMSPITPSLQDRNYGSAYEQPVEKRVFDTDTTKDVRVLDLHWQRAICVGDRSEKLIPQRWRSYHVGEPIHLADRHIGDLRRRDVWEEVADTCLACGTFPLVTDGVNLTRQRHEMGHHWPDFLNHADAFTFTYLDINEGGYLPLREARRLAAHVDAGARNAPAERMFLRIDAGQKAGGGDGAAVRLPTPPHEIATTRPPLRESFPQLARLLAATGADGRILDLPIPTHAPGRVAARAAIHGQLDKGSITAPTQLALAQLYAYSESVLDARRAHTPIPPTTLDIATELARTVAEQAHRLPSIQGQTLDLDAGLPAHADEWLRALAMTAIDLALDWEWEERTTRQVSVAPVIAAQVDARSVNDRALPLPGDLADGLAGLLSPEVSAVEAPIGRYCAQLAIQRHGAVRPRHLHVPSSRFTAGQRERFERDIRLGLDQLRAQINLNHQRDDAETIGT